MTDQNYVNEFAQAVYELAIENNCQDEIRDNLDQMLKAFIENEQFIYILCSYSLNKSDKKSLINDVFKDRIQSILLNLLYYLVDKQLERNIISICERIIDYIDQNNKRLYVKIYTSFVLEQTAIEQIEHKIQKITNKEPITTIIIDHNLIGGIKIEYDTNVLDYSIVTKIRAIKQSMYRGD